ncbi:hypothetical protein BS47DRAFT_1396884 [Hydnum rufescens UP504]|uniref:Uncharacterized protein n=1 Tax=Hydnum rufescens UP504 TaxID=1448309 RepID=A0A9P6AP65_9AGAM|nr:hypothetical protein BS47DRAFT_1396884 [Hydnum rufescens UP504]
MPVGQPQVALHTSQWQWLSHRGLDYAACPNIPAQKAFEAMTFAEYLKVYHWSIPESKEPIADKEYNEPATDNVAGQQLKEGIIQKQQEAQQWWFCHHWGLKQSGSNATLNSKQNSSQDATNTTLTVNPPPIPLPVFNPDLLSAQPITLPLKSTKNGPHHQQIEHVYSSLYWNSKIKALVAPQTEIDAAQVLAGDDADAKVKEHMSITTQQHITHQCWADKSDKVKAIVKAKREALYQEDLATWNKWNADLHTPQKQQEYTSPNVFFYLL